MGCCTTTPVEHELINVDPLNTVEMDKTNEIRSNKETYRITVIYTYSSNKNACSESNYSFKTNKESIKLKVDGNNTIQHIINLLSRSTSFKAEHEYFSIQEIELFDTTNTDIKLYRNKTLYESNITQNTVLIAKYPPLSITVIYTGNSNNNTRSKSNYSCKTKEKLEVDANSNNNTCSESNYSCKTNKESIILFCACHNNGFPLQKSIIIDQNATITELKESVSCLYHLELDEFRLSINSLKPILHDHLNLIDYGITDGMTLCVTQILSKRSSSVATLEVSGYNTIEDIINLLSRSKSFKAEHKYHSIQEIELFDSTDIDIKLSRHKTLYESNITPNTVLIAKYPPFSINAFCDYNDITLFDITLFEGRHKKILDHFNKYMTRYKANVIDIYLINKGWIHDMKIFNAILKTKENKNEYQLYHGTSFENAGKIIKYGFNRDYNKRSMYGYGTYLAMDPAKASRYCVRYNKDIAIYCMLVCKTLVGNMAKGIGCKGRISLVDSNMNMNYDSLVDNVESPSIVVINKDYHSIPLFLILFRYN